MKQTKEQFVGVTYDGLLAENAALRTQLADVTESMGRVEERCAKLRKLAGFVLRFETMTDGCGDTCPYVCRNCENECYFRNVASELGVEI